MTYLATQALDRINTPVRLRRRAPRLALVPTRRRPIQHLVNVSGGKDSAAVYLLALESGRPFRAVFADTGNEHELTYEFVSRLHERTGGPRVEVVRADFSADLARHRAYVLRVWPKLGMSDEVVAEAVALHEPTGNPFLDLCVSKGRFPSTMARFCTQSLKASPIETQIVGPMLRDGPVLQWLGIRADESRHRATQPRFNHHESGSMLWRPIFRWTVDDVWAMHRRHGLTPNPLYAMGMGRVGCMPCINCRKDELRAIAEQFPEHIDRIERWERVVAAANKRHAATFFPAVKDPMDVTRPGTYATIRTVVEWSRTTRGGRQYALFFDNQTGGCTSELGLCEGLP
ncbi:phosphoadenosine phosphosulfate reductase domain-containing protein [Paraburkholderia aspalathi]|uniref:3'-phosphoadenosine 5'-phosphosulfate sulfotransferase (PAPS reductase)/FAD synthetase n=1 Tax=Paraburkholderia aspalathi TaxID=1324617 RepID=A0A1I7ABZ8_9BURK|nr:phosphoadenosine phosphosulfate reductase family protein [Paraburkholderia aspalathi]SFT72340.1 3'-phosphoadenosine 5'-phosphosulfate sulfotransferase (PAPS reductase)/FAD synthetase [Paraburkholderia aspalathi]